MWRIQRGDLQLTCLAVGSGGGNAVFSVQPHQCWSLACCFINAIHLRQTQCHGIGMDVSPVCRTVPTTAKFCGGSCISKKSLENALTLFLQSVWC